MSKHTPGPWRLKRDPCHFDTLTTVEAGVVGNRKPFMPMMLVQVGGDADFVEAEANARLISAAPDLLAALKLCSGWVEAYGRSELRREVRAAITKATGGNDDSRK